MPKEQKQARISGFRGGSVDLYLTPELLEWHDSLPRGSRAKIIREAIKAYREGYTLKITPQMAAACLKVWSERPEMDQLDRDTLSWASDILTQMQ